MKDKLIQPLYKIQYATLLIVLIAILLLKIQCRILAEFSLILLRLQIYPKQNKRKGITRLIWDVDMLLTQINTDLYNILVE